MFIKDMLSPPYHFLILYKWHKLQIKMIFCVAAFNCHAHQKVLHNSILLIFIMVPFDLNSKKQNHIAFLQWKIVQSRYASFTLRPVELVQAAAHDNIRPQYDYKMCI